MREHYAVGLRWLGAAAEAGVGFVEDEADVEAGGAVAVFADEEVGFAGAGAVGVVVVLAVEEADQVGVVLDVAGLAQVGHGGAFVGAVVDVAVELGERDD